MCIEVQSIRISNAQANSLVFWLVFKAVRLHDNGCHIDAVLFLMSVSVIRNACLKESNIREF